MEKIFNVQNPWFTYIKEGKKIIEGRLNKGQFSELKVGETIIWENNNNKFKTKIIRITKYNTFYDMLNKEGLQNCLPNIKTLEDGVNVYRQFYTAEKEKEHGVLAINIKLI